MQFDEVNGDENNNPTHNFNKSNNEEKLLFDLLDSCKAIMDYHGTKLTITACQETQPNIEKPQLSLRESEVLQNLANGLSPDQIALKMGVKIRTVRKHLCNLEMKFKTDSRDQLMARAGYLQLCNPYQSSS